LSSVRGRRQALILTFTLSTSIVLIATPAQAATLSVNSTADVVSNNGQCTLREAIINANGNDQAGSTDCAAGSGDDVIRFSVTGVIRLQAELPPVLSGGGAVTLEGPEESDLVRISGDSDDVDPGNVRIITVGNAADLFIERLTIEEGSGAGNGGAILVGPDATLTVDDSWMSLSHATIHGGAIYGMIGSWITIHDSVFAGNTAAFGGGAVATDDLANIDGTVFFSNRAQEGGAVFVEPGAFTNIADTTFAFNVASDLGGAVFVFSSGFGNIDTSGLFLNSATNQGGGVYNGGTMNVRQSLLWLNESGFGGGILANAATTNVSNSTLFQNLASVNGGGIYANGGLLNIGYATIAENTATAAGGGVAASAAATVNVGTTILSDNTSGNCQVAGGATIVNQGYDIDSGTTCGFGTANDSQSDTDPGLGELDDNGGPTLSMLPGEFAINHVPLHTNGCGDFVMEDQREFARPDDVTVLCDVGAVEADAVAPPGRGTPGAPPGGALLVSVQGGGHVTSSPAGIDCFDDCTESVTARTVFTLTATPAPGWKFAGWTGACSGTGNCSVTVGPSQMLNATFVQTEGFRLRTAHDGKGKVTSRPGGIECGADCVSNFDAGSHVRLRAHAADGWHFVRWSRGQCKGSTDATCVLDMTQNRRAAAVFQKD